jgi:hypothetical protein
MVCIYYSHVTFTDTITVSMLTWCVSVAAMPRPRRIYYRHTSLLQTHIFTYFLQIYLLQIYLLQIHLLQIHLPAIYLKRHHIYYRYNLPAIYLKRHHIYYRHAHLVLIQPHIAFIVLGVVTVLVRPAPNHCAPRATPDIEPVDARAQPRHACKRIHPRVREHIL